MVRLARFVSAALIAMGAAAGPVQAVHAADLTVYSGDPGICGEPWVLSKITDRFRYQVRHVPNLPDVAITDFHGIRERRYEPPGEWKAIERRYCGATVSLSDGRDRSIWYLIETGQGFASIGNNVEFCVAGFDRWFVYNGGCRVLR